LLIRMRSQVQVLAGPPPIVAGQSVAGGEPGALAAGLGRTGAAPSIPAGTSPGPSGAAHPAVSLGDDHPAWSSTQPEDGSHAAAAATSRCSLPLVPTAQPPATGRSGRRPGLPGRSAGKRGRRGPHPTRRPGSATDPPDQPDVGSVARVPGSATVDRAVDGPAATGASTRPGGQGRPATSTWSPPPPPEWEETDASGPTKGRHQTAGHRTGGHRTAGRWTVDSSRPTAEPSGRRPQVTGHRTAGSRTPETGWVDTACWTPATDAVACLLAGSTTATTPDRSRAAGRSSGQTPSGRATTRTAQQQRRRGHPRRHGRVWPPPRPLAAVVRRRPAGASAHCCPETRIPGY
jgi:hypothetical protein